MPKQLREFPHVSPRSIVRGWRGELVNELFDAVRFRDVPRGPYGRGDRSGHTTRPRPYAKDHLSWVRCISDDNVDPFALLRVYDSTYDATGPIYRLNVEDTPRGSGTGTGSGSAVDTNTDIDMYAGNEQYPLYAGKAGWCKIVTPYEPVRVRTPANSNVGFMTDIELRNGEAVLGGFGKLVSVTCRDSEGRCHVISPVEIPQRFFTVISHPFIQKTISGADGFPDAPYVGHPWSTGTTAFVWCCPLPFIDSNVAQWDIDAYASTVGGGAFDGNNGPNAGDPYPVIDLSSGWSVTLEPVYIRGFPTGGLNYLWPGDGPAGVDFNNFSGVPAPGQIINARRGPNGWMALGSLNEIIVGVVVVDGATTLCSMTNASGESFPFVSLDSTAWNDGDEVVCAWDGTQYVAIIGTCSESVGTGSGS